MTLVGNDFYVANTDALMRFPYAAGQTRISARGEKVTDLPAGPINHPWTKNVVAAPARPLLYVAIGSNSNVAENGSTAERGRAAIWQVEPSSGR